MTSNVKHWGNIVLQFSLAHERALPVIEDAIKRFNETTCIQFVPHTKTLEQELGHTGWVNFVSDG